MAQSVSTKGISSLDAPLATAYLMATNPVLGKVWSEFMSESARFMTMRLEADLEMQRKVLSCKNQAELIELQTRFMTAAAAEYVEGAMKLFRIAIDASGEIAESAIARRISEYDDVPV